MGQDGTTVTADSVRGWVEGRSDKLRRTALAGQTRTIHGGWSPDGEDLHPTRPSAFCTKYLGVGGFISAHEKKDAEGVSPFSQRARRRSRHLRSPVAFTPSHPRRATVPAVEVRQVPRNNTDTHRDRLRSRTTSCGRSFGIAKRRRRSLEKICV